MKTFATIIKLVSRIGVIVVLSCTTMGVLHLIDLSTVNFIQDLFMAFLFFIGIPTAFYVFNTHQKEKILKRFNKNR